MRKLFTLLFLLGVFLILNAEPITPDKALSVAKSYIGYKTTQAKTVPLSFKLVYTGAPSSSLKNKSVVSAPYYVYNVGENDGFVIVSGDDELTPVVGYADDGAFETSRMPDALRSWLDNYGRFVSDVWNGKSVAVKNSSVVQKGEIVIAPMLKMQWGQSAPYNNLTPLSGSTHMVSGCGATAMAQLMKYHNWPDRGVGSNSYDCEGVGTLSVDFSQSVYDWENMLDVYPDGKYSDVQANAVARLVYDAGVALNMAYTLQESGSSSFTVVEALPKYFKYKHSVTCKDRQSTATPEWIRIIRDELSAKRPILYRGSSVSGGHIFVCDGLDSNDYLHVNWGWDGYCNGFFNMNYMDPYNPSVGGGSGQYNDGQMIIVGIEPLKPGNPDAFIPLSLVLRKPTMVSVTQINRNMSFVVTANEISNRNAVPISGYLGLALYKNGEFERILGTVNINLNPNYYYKTISFGSTVIPSSYADGDYELRIVSKTSTGSVWIPATCNLDVAGNILVNISKGIMTFSKPLVRVSDVQFTAPVSGATTLYSQRTGILSISLQNNSRSHYTGPLYIELVGEGESSVAARFSDGVVLFGETELNLNLEHTLQVPAGEYIVMVYYDDPENGLMQVRGELSRITVLPVPTVPVLQIFSKLEDYTGASAFDKESWLYVSRACKNLGTPFSGKLYLYARPADDPSGQEYLLGERSGFSVPAESSVKNWFYIYGYPEYLPVGTYEIYVKYDQGDKRVRMEPFFLNSLIAEIGDWLGVAGNSIAGEVALSPNPVKDRLTVKSTDLLREISIFSASGMFIRKFACEGNSEVVISVGEFPAGGYILHAVTDKKKWSRIFIKQ